MTDNRAPAVPLASRLAPDQRAALLATLASGKSLRTASLLPGMPSEGVLARIAEGDRELAAEIRIARALAADALAAECVTIADEPSDHRDDVAHRRLRIETRQRLARAWGPATYGDASRVTVAGDASAPLVLSDAERAARIAAILASAAAGADAPAVTVQPPALPE